MHLGRSLAFYALRLQQEAQLQQAAASPKVLSTTALSVGARLCFRWNQCTNARVALRRLTKQQPML